MGQKVGKTGALGSEKWGKWQGRQEHLGIVSSGAEGREERS